MANSGGSYIVDEEGNEVLIECTDVKAKKAPKKEVAEDQSEKSAKQRPTS